MVAEPVIIRYSGARYKFAVVTVSIMTVVFLVGAAKAAHDQDTSRIAIWLAGAAIFALSLIFIATVRVVLSGDEIMYERLFHKTRSLRLDYISSARSIARMGRLVIYHYLVIEPLDQQSSSIWIRTDLFSDADVQSMREFLGEKLQPC
jgi:hypothetical protein